MSLQVRASEGDYSWTDRCMARKIQRPVDDATDITYDTMIVCKKRSVMSNGKW